MQLPFPLLQALLLGTALSLAVPASLEPRENYVGPRRVPVYPGLEGVFSNTTARSLSPQTDKRRLPEYVGIRGNMTNLIEQAGAEPSKRRLPQYAGVASNGTHIDGNTVSSPPEESSGKRKVKRRTRTYPGTEYCPETETETETELNRRPYWYSPWGSSKGKQDKELPVILGKGPGRPVKNSGYLGTGIDYPGRNTGSREQDRGWGRGPACGRNRPRPSYNKWQQEQRKYKPGVPENDWRGQVP